MLKRYQVLLPDWLEKYIKLIADSHDLSFSEIVRAEICFAILEIIPSIYPEYKPNITPKEMFRLMREDFQENMRRDEVHRVLSKIYFETRKAVEYQIEKGKKLKKE